MAWPDHMLCSHNARNVRNGHGSPRADPYDEQFTYMTVPARNHNSLGVFDPAATWESSHPHPGQGRQNIIDAFHRGLILLNWRSPSCYQLLLLRSSRREGSSLTSFPVPAFSSSWEFIPGSSQLPSVSEWMEAAAMHASILSAPWSQYGPPQYLQHVVLHFNNVSCLSAEKRWRDWKVS